VVIPRISIQTAIFIAFSGLLIACKEKENKPYEPHHLEYWLGTYEIDTIGGSPVSCDVDFLNDELLTIESEYRWRVENLCSGELLSEGDFEFNMGFFNLFVDWSIQDPDVPEYEMQIFQYNQNRIRLFTCAPNTGNCTVRLGRKIS